jgi:hypothetical protein
MTGVPNTCSRVVVTARFEIKVSRHNRLTFVVRLQSESSVTTLAPKLDEIKWLPRWARMSFATRCARRAERWILDRDGLEPELARTINALLARIEIDTAHALASRSERFPEIEAFWAAIKSVEGADESQERFFSALKGLTKAHQDATLAAHYGEKYQLSPCLDYSDKEDSWDEPSAESATFSITKSFEAVPTSLATLNLLDFSFLSRLTQTERWDYRAGVPLELWDKIDGVHTSKLRGPEMTQKHAFLSYCRDNQADAKSLHDELLVAGFNIWLDSKNLIGGAQWKREIRNAIKESFAVIACFSEEVERRDRSGMFPELRDAIEEYRSVTPGTVYLIPVRFSECSIPDVSIDSTTTLNDLQYIDLFPATKKRDGLRRLCESLKRASVAR